MKKSLTAFVFLLMSLPLITIAHPGHGDDGGYTIKHYFNEPLHIGISVVLFVAVYIALRFYIGKKAVK